MARIWCGGRHDHHATAQPHWIQTCSDSYARSAGEYRLYDILFLRADLILRVFILSRRMIARRSRAKHVVGCEENAQSAFSSQPIQSGERRRREQALGMAIRQTLGLC